MKTDLITLTTDFGEGSPYVAQMKGVILGIQPHVTLVDITHSIEPQDIRQAALIMHDSTRHFPAGSLHLCVVDPGVGTQRSIVYGAIGGQQYVAPDNGVLSLLAQQDRTDELITVCSPRFWRTPVSPTFHGRDIMAPVAAHVSRGLPPVHLGPRQAALVALPWPDVQISPRSMQGHVLTTDRFGNLITDIARSHMPGDVAPSAIRVVCGSHLCELFVQTYGQASSGQVVALFGSSDRLEIAVTNGNAARQLGVGVNTQVHVSW